MSADCGTYAGYRAGCRCDGCKAANAAYHREWSDRGHEIRPEQHGTPYAYASLRCRCTDCTAAHIRATSAWAILTRARANAAAGRRLTRAQAAALAGSGS